MGDWNVSYTIRMSLFRNQSGWIQSMMIKAQLQNLIIIRGARAAADINKVVKQNIAEERSQL